jgi:hypothetical protein
MSTSDIDTDTAEMPIATTTTDASAPCAFDLPPSDFTIPGSLTRLLLTPDINHFGTAIAPESMMSVPDNVCNQQCRPCPATQPAGSTLEG